VRDVVPPLLHICLTTASDTGHGPAILSGPSYISYRLRAKLDAPLFFLPPYIYAIWTSISLKKLKSAYMWRASGADAPLPDPLKDPRCNTLEIICPKAFRRRSMDLSLPPKNLLRQTMSSVESPASLTPACKTVTQIHNMISSQI
jgi:hypothetical protein